MYPEDPIATESTAGYLRDMATTPDRFTNLSVAALVFAAIASAGLAEQNPAAPLPPTNATVTITVGDTESSALVQPMISADAAASGWSDIKDSTTGNRAQFLAGLQRMEAKVNAEFNELTAKRPALKNMTKAKELDQALAALSNARFFSQDHA